MLGRFPLPQLGPPATPLSPAHEEAPFETRNDRHNIRGEAEIELPLVPGARETPGGAVLAQRLIGACGVEIDDPPYPLV